jgi:hypothetical protein
MAKLKLAPSPLQLMGGPHTQPIGTLSAIDEDTGKAWSGALEWSCTEKDWVFEPSGASATVGAYRTGSATVTARDTSTGQMASASVQVAVLDGGLPGRPM